MKVSELPPELQQRLVGSVTKPIPKVAPSAEETFAFQCRAMRLPLPEREFRFAESIGRGFRFDFCWQRYSVAVEVEGLSIRRVNGELMVGGRHVHPDGWRRDAVKYAIAAVMGWSVLRFEQSQVKDGTAIDYTVQLMRAKGWRP